MKVFLCVSCLMVVFASCIRRPDSGVSRLIPPPQLLDPLFEFYSEKNITKLENLHDFNKVSDDDVKYMKKYLHTTLAKIISSLPAKIDHHDTRISYIPDGRIISYYSIHSLCEASNSSKCFRLEVIPEQLPGLSGSFIIKVWQLPANKDIAEVSKPTPKTSFQLFSMHCAVHFHID